MNMDEFDKNKYVTKEEYDIQSEKINQIITYTESLAKAINLLYSYWAELTPPEKLKILRKSKIEEIFNAK
jgi:uncharacterized tellurite resistance protein B-like protein